ncbi:MAG TPA: hypothetical protein VK745_31225 [Polyangiaceae bacterium]|jgi:hypothetical protein|nr:hypothetical protein [Polyangiaceae bacterium]
MGFVCRVAVSVLCVASSAALAAACDSAAADSGALAANAGSAASLSDAGGDAADAEPTPDSLAFEPSDTLNLEPKATQQLTVATTPPGNFHVRFALLGSGSDSAPGDAALDASEVDTDATGVAKVTLTAPSSPTSFTVRASVATVQAWLGVSVSASNYTTLLVLPSYSGMRPVTEWTATASAGVKCAELMGNPPPDGPLVATAAAGQALELVKVPVGVDLAVTLRAGHYIGGCADQSALSEEDGNQVLVYASDRPLNLAATTLALRFGPTQPAAALSKLLSASISDAESALVNGATSDVTALLDAMVAATATASREPFSAARLAQGWDSALDTALGSGAATLLRAPADRWFNAGLASFYAPDTFATQLSALPGGALMTLSTVAGVPAGSAGFPTTFQTTWSADSSDTLLLGTQLSWLPSRLLTALAVAPALLEVPQALSVESALSDSADCALVAQTLIAHGTTPGSTAYAGCNESCVLDACNAAIAALWQNASDASGNVSATLSVTGTGAAVVGDDASVTSLSGSWVGQLQVGADTAPAAGPVSAVATTN